MGFPLLIAMTHLIKYTYGCAWYWVGVTVLDGFVFGAAYNRGLACKVGLHALGWAGYYAHQPAPWWKKAPCS